MDLHAFQVNNEDKEEKCHTYYANKDNCTGVKQDLDNREGGLKSSKTITFSDISTNSHYTYMVFIDDYSNHGASLRESEAELTVTDGQDTSTYDMPNVAWDGSSRYWLVGCIIISEEGWDFEFVNRLTKDDPSVAEPFVCHEMVVPPPPTLPPFWPGAEVKVVIKNGLNNAVVLDPGVSVIFDKISGGNIDREEVHRMAGTMANGEIIFPITSDGEYSIEVTADGYITDETNFLVRCNVANGIGCTPTKLISLSPVMPRGNLRIIMNWNEKPEDLDLTSIQIDTNTQETCKTNYADKTGCTGVKLDWDNRKGGDQGPETITYEGLGSYRQYIYMIYVDDYSMHDNSDENGDQFRDSQARLTITDGVETVKVDFEESGYNKERYWLAGCVRSDGDGFEWKKIETFARSLDRQTLLRCMEVFDLTGTLMLQETTNYH